MVNAENIVSWSAPAGAKEADRHSMGLQRMFAEDSEKNLSAVMLFLKEMTILR